MVLSGPHGCIGIALILEDGKNSFHLSVFGSLLKETTNWMLDYTDSLLI